MILLLASNSSSGQNGPYLQPPTIFTGSYSSGTQSNTVFNAELNNVQVSNAANYDIQARQYIHMGPGNVAAALTSGQFHAHIEESPLDVVSYYPSATGFDNVAVYDKFELGIKLPAAITKKVDDFFGKYKITNDHNGYGCEYNQGRNYINPYDPDQISVEATFSFPERPPQVVYGFYYREYHYSNGITPTYATNWIENLELQYHWRVRFAPKEVGTYTVTWVVRVNGAVVLRDDIGQSFTTIPSSSLGFIKLGQNNKFMVTQPDRYSPERTILPIGLVNANPKVAGTDANDPVPSTDCLPWGSGDLEYPSRYWWHRETIKTRIADQGGNIVRMMYKPYSYDIEWEHLGVYDAAQKKPIQNGMTVVQARQAGFLFAEHVDPNHVTDYKGTSRQAVMWEFDRLLDMAKENNLYIQLCVETEENGFNVKPGATWTRSPYFTSAISLPKDSFSLLQFFTDPKAKSAYKKKLRYMIARYGYSTNIADFEMFNEVQFLANQMGGGNASDIYFKPWLDEMLTYIKGPAGLNHRDHLFTASYEDGNGGDQVGDLPGLDFMSRHPYNWNLDVSFFAAYNDVKYFRNRYKKPCQAGEMGIQADWGCFNSMFPELIGPTFHTLLWSTAFISGVTSGLDMWGHVGLEVDPAAPTTHPCGDGYIQHFKPLQAFIKNIEFDRDNYVPKYDNSDPVETFYLIDNNGINATNALGYVRNRTFWWTNFTNPGSPLYDPNLAQEYQASIKQNCTSSVSLPSAQPVLTGSLSGVSIGNLKSQSWYAIDWYNTYVDPAIQNPVISSSYVFSSPTGKVYIDPPPFGDCEHQEFGFKLNEVFSKKDGNTVQPLSSGISVYPNPASDKIYFRSNGKEIKNPVIELYDLTGRLIATQRNSNELDLPKVANGIYTVRISGEHFTEVVKVKIEQ